MLRKAVYAGAGTLLLCGLLVGRDACSYVGTSVGWVKHSVKSSVPVEFEIERARKMITSLGPEIRRNMHLIAKEEVEIERLENQVDRLEKKLAKGRTELTRMRDDLETNQDSIYYAGHRYSRDQVKVDLANRFTRFKTNDITLTNLTKVLNARHRGLDAARQKLEEMLAAKRQLVVDVENLEARQKMVEVAKTASDLNLDNSQLARTKDLITSIQTRIEVTERLVSVETEYHDEIPLEESFVADDIVEQVAEYLDNELPNVEVVAQNQ